jgi:hypothetical protein
MTVITKTEFQITVPFQDHTMVRQYSRRHRAHATFANSKDLGLWAKGA